MKKQTLEEVFLIVKIVAGFAEIFVIAFLAGLLLNGDKLTIVIGN